MSVDWLVFKGIASGICFDADDAGGGSSATPGSAAPDSSKPETAPDKPTDSRTFTQEELTKHAAEAQRKGKQIGINQFLEALRQEGIEVGSIDDIKTRLAEDEKRRKSEMTETEKLQKALDKANADAKAKEDALVQKDQEFRLERRNNAVISALSAGKTPARKPGQVLVLMQSEGLLDPLLKEDGSLDTAAVTSTVETFQKNNPELFAPTSPGSPSNSGGRTPSPTDKDVQQASQGQRRTMRNW